MLFLVGLACAAGRAKPCGGFAAASPSAAFVRRLERPASCAGAGRASPDERRRLLCNGRWRRIASADRRIPFYKRKSGRYLPLFSIYYILNYLACHNNSHCRWRKCNRRRNVPPEAFTLDLALWLFRLFL